MSNGQAMVPTQAQAGMTVRESAMSREMVRHAEAQATAIGAMLKAQVQARYELALIRPRNWLDVETKLLGECQRPLFAESAVYAVPRGKKKDPNTGQWVDNIIEGPSIRFAEAALRCMTNVLPETRVLLDDEGKRIVQVSVTDLEANITYSHEVVVVKEVERKKAKEGDVVLGERLNSYGEVVYRLRATEDDVTMRVNALVSKALRTLALRILPGDILDACMERIAETAAKKDAADPMAARKRMVEAFAKLGVSAGQIEEYLGKAIPAATPNEIKSMKGIHTALAEGHLTWATVMAERGAADADGVVATSEPKKSQADRLKEKTAAAAAKKADKPAEKPAETKAAEAAKPEPAKVDPKAEPAAETKPAAPKEGWEDLDVGDTWKNPKTGKLMVIVRMPPTIAPLGKLPQDMPEPENDEPREGFE